MKKKILLIIALIILLVPAFIFLVPVKDGRTIYQNIIYQRKVNAGVQPDNYDKMKITYATIVERKTGTENFNTPDLHSLDDGSLLSDMDGHDVSEKDNYVRTFDNVQYKVEVGVALNLDNPNVNESTQLSGGVIKVKATLPDDPDSHMYWNKEAWMSNARISEDGRTLTAYYKYSNNEHIVGGNQQLTFSINAGGYKKELSTDINPTFEIWMEGNKPDSNSSSANSVSLHDDAELAITGEERYNLSVFSGPVNTPSTKDGIKGRYVNFGVNLHYQGVAEEFGPKGLALPTNRELGNVQLKLTYKYSNYEDLDTYYSLDESNVNGILNGTEIIAFNKSYYGLENPDAWPTPISNYAGSCNTFTGRYGVMSSSACGYYQSGSNLFDSGNVSVSLTGNEMSVINTGATNTYYSLDDGYTFTIFVDAIELFIPYLNDGNKHKYNFEIELLDYDLNNGSLMSQDVNEYDNKETFTFEDYLKGDISSNLSSNGLTVNGDEEYIFPNGTKMIYSILRAADGPYLGGDERLITFNADMFSFEKYDENNYFYIYEQKNGTSTPLSSIPDGMIFEYGIYKSNPSEGLTTLALVNSANKLDFDWYSTFEEASQHGKVTAIHYDNSNYRGNNDYYSFYFKVRETGKEENFNKVGTLRQKVWLYEDEERNVVYTKYSSDSTTSYRPTSYTGLKVEDGAYPTAAGESLFIIDDFVRFSAETKTYDKNLHTVKDVFNIKDEVLEFGYKAYAPVYYNTSGNHFRNVKFSMEVDSPYLTYKPNSCSYEPVSIVEEGNKITLNFYIENYDLRNGNPDGRCQFYIDPLTPNDTRITLTASSVEVENIRQYGNNGKYPAYARIINLSGSSTRKILSKEIVEENEPFLVSGNINNISDDALNNVKTIELLPKDGDSRNSIIHGSYVIKINELAEGMTIYYSIGNPSDIGIETDDFGYLHIKNVDLANDDRWIQLQIGDTVPAAATAIATLTDTVPTNTSKEFTYQVIPTDNQKGDVYYFGQYASSDNLVENIFSTYKSVAVLERRISGTVFDDLNRNDLLNDTDARENNYTVELLNESGTKIDETTTNNEGIYEFSLPNSGYYYVRFASIPDGYELTPKGSSENNSKVNSNMTTDAIDQTGVGHNPVETVGNVNLGMRKKQATLIVKYLDKNNDQPLADQTETTVYYTDPYETHGLTTIPTNYSFLENAGDPVADVVNKDEIVVIYYYDYTPATVTTRHYIDGTTTKIHEDVIQNKKFTQEYSTSALDTTNLNYEYVRTDGDSTSGTVAKTNIVVNYYYRLKKGTVTTHHYLYDNGETTTKLAPDVTQEWNYTQTYTTSVSNNIPNNYEFYKKSDNYTAVMDSPNVVVNYYYQLKDSNLTTTITQVGTEEITSKNDNVDYEITYTAKAVDYIGNGTVTITDTLPYEIDVDNSDLNGGTYNASNKTITWTTDWTNIDTYAGRDEITITKNIRLVYDGIVGRDRIMTSTVTGSVTLSNNSREVQATTSTNIRISGNIKVIYIDKDTQEEILDAVEETNLVGETFICEAKEKDGYRLVTPPDTEEYEFEEDDQLITYEYEHIKFEIKAVVIGVGGKITGDEDVYWGEDSTIDNIVIEADEGYIIEAILINGVRQELVLGEEKLILSNFVNVLENKNIEVIFAKKPQENPNTNNTFKTLVLIVATMAMITLVIKALKIKKYL